MDMHYVTTRSSSRLIKKHAVWYYSLTVLLPYCLQRLPTIFEKLNCEERLILKLRKSIEKLQLLWDTITVIQFLVFLNRGGCQSVLENILGLKAVHNEEPKIGTPFFITLLISKRSYKIMVLETIDFEVMNRELIWNGFSDILIFVIPLINIRKLWKVVKRRTYPKSQSNPESFVIDYRSQLNNCPYCEKQPVVPYMAGCQHCFCYYCLSSNLLANSEYPCPLCDIPLTSLQLKPLVL